MKVCNEIKRLIDEADQPDMLSFEVSNHLSVCDLCKSFANERAALRSLLASGNRVSVPDNFNAMLNARIAEAKAKQAFSWLSPASFMRLGAATAAVAVMVFAAQYTDLFSRGDQAMQPESQVASAATTSAAEAPKPEVVTAQDGDINGFGDIVPRHSPRGAGLPVRIAQTHRDYQRRGARIATTSEAPDNYPSIESGVVLVRGPNGEREVPMPTISVGAQPLLYVNAGRQSQPVRSVATSF